MKTLTCDVCHSIVQAPVMGRNYQHLAHRDLCESCHDKLQAVIKPVVRTKQPFDYAWFNRFVQESIEKAVVRGRIQYGKAVYTAVCRQLPIIFLADSL